MTLSRQLLFLIVVLLVSIMIASLAISLLYTRQFVQSQLESHAQDAATSLGLTMSPHVAEDDIVTATRMLDAVFDRGFYRIVSYRDTEGNVVHERKGAQEIEGVPKWFIDNVTLVTPSAEALVMGGWNQAGSVLVSSHPGYAYEQLWRTATRLFAVFGIAAIVAGLGGVLALRRVLSPLRDVEEQANAICERKYPLVEKTPRTRELSRIVTAMNRLSVRVKQMMGKQEALATRFRAEANQDALTETANRRFFQALLENAIDSDDLFEQGALYLVAINDFKAYNDTKGFAAGDEVLKAAASHLKEVVDSVEHATLARLAGADFAVLAQDLAADEARSLAARLTQALLRLYEDGLWDNPEVGHVGGAYYHGSQTPSELLAEADAALRASQGDGSIAFRLADSRSASTVHTRSATDWRNVVQSSLGHGKIELFGQPIVRCPGRETVHREVFARLVDPDEPDKLLSAGVFMPHAQRFGLATAVDREVLALVFKRLGEERGATSYAVNVSPASILDEGFLAWLEQQLRQSPDYVSRFSIEMPESAVVPRIEQLRPTFSRLNALGLRLGLDKFGRGFSSFSYLQSLHLAYIKIDGSIQRGLADNKDSQFYLQTMSDIAHGLEMLVYAESIEDEAVWDMLPGLHVDGGQGFLLGRPETI